jgi:hypothetical protein
MYISDATAVKLSTGTIDRSGEARETFNQNKQVIRHRYDFE